MVPIWRFQHFQYILQNPKLKHMATRFSNQPLDLYLSKSLGPLSFTVHKLYTLLTHAKQLCGMTDMSLVSLIGLWCPLQRGNNQTDLCETTQCSSPFARRYTPTCGFISSSCGGLWFWSRPFWPSVKALRYEWWINKKSRKIQNVTHK